MIMVAFAQNQFPAVRSSCVFPNDWPDTDFPNYELLLRSDPCFVQDWSSCIQRVAVLRERPAFVRFHQPSSHEDFVLASFD